MIAKETKTALIEAYKINERDTGSPEVQVAILTTRINELTEHMKKNPKDFHSQRGLSKMVGHRKQLLNYLAKKDIERYRAVIIIQHLSIGSTGLQSTSLGLSAQLKKLSISYSFSDLNPLSFR